MYDPEAIYQDADLEMADLEAAAAANAAKRKAGICTHGWMLGGGGTVNRTLAEIEADRAKGHFPDRATDASIGCQDDIGAGQVLCLDCGQLIADPLA